MNQLGGESYFFKLINAWMISGFCMIMLLTNFEPKYLIEFGALNSHSIEALIKLEI